MSQPDSLPPTNRADEALESLVRSGEGALAALSRAAAGTRGLKPVEAQRRDLFRRPFMARELAVDAVVFDPRAGIQAATRATMMSTIGTSVNVSASCGEIP